MQQGKCCQHLKLAADCINIIGKKCFQTGLQKTRLNQMSP